MGERPKVPKGAPRNWWIQGVEGWTEPDGTFFVPEKPRVITGGGRLTTSGFNLNIYQRVSRDPRGVAWVARMEGRAALDGWLTFRMWQVSKGKLLVPASFRSNREGILGEAAEIFEEAENAERDPGTDGEDG
jgi:hypothetical protein